MIDNKHTAAEIANAVSRNEQSVNRPPRLVPVKRIRELDPSWPWSLQGTYKLIAGGHLPCLRVGRRILLTAEHLEAFARGGRTP